MPFIKQKNQDFFYQNNHLELSDAYLKNNLNKFKKITGSRLASVLGLNKYVSPFKVWTMMVNLYKEDMDPTLANAGNIIEPKIRNFVETQLDLKFKSYNPIQVRFDVFQDNETFGGIPDGEPIDSNGEINYSNNNPMLEIKTSSFDSLQYENINGVLMMKKDQNGLPIILEKDKKYDSWFNQKTKGIQICDEYAYQLGLYLFLRKINHGIFAICFLKPNDYKNPQDFKIENKNLKLVDMEINLPLFSQKIDEAKYWYDNYVKKGISPILTSEDEKWLRQQKQI